MVITKIWRHIMTDLFHSRREILILRPEIVLNWNWIVPVYLFFQQRS